MAGGTRSLAVALVVACTAYALTPLASTDSTGSTAGDHVLLAVLLLIFVATISACVWAASRDRVVTHGKWLLIAGQYSAVALWGVFGPAWSTLPAVAAGAGLLVWPARTGYTVCGVTAFITVYLAAQESDVIDILGRAFIVLVVFVALSTALELRKELELNAHRTARLAVAAGQDRIYRDLHDILGRSLTVIAIQSDTAATVAETDSAAAQDQMRRVNTVAREAISDMRSIVRGHRHAGLASEVQIARDLLSTSGVDADVDDSIEALPPEIDDVFGWVVRESVTNILRHGRSTHASITVQRTSDGARLEVLNDHRGRNSRGSGSGIDGMRERVDAIGGTLEVRRQGGCFTVVASVPVKEEHR
ncbi:hypothetical protein GCM10007304_38480 [Rhodococcoides trifolii]|uniref:Signal transduction histidine kinase subgroup 3 dimerisation and phosphoacceptor domain-containing protein n=1 Tax=Rhodococcoides trifolii TaxID=908250 RepID=A0A917G3H2_9NOCA|nr:sensor histidine kinase [Rhodococcus trifolii]GGG20936.1 hypothetical protein GCM10007304_38480 [Rhodococcus trifolii]